MRRLAWLVLLVWLTLSVLLLWVVLVSAQVVPSVELAWDAVSHPQLAGYVVQRCAVPVCQSTCQPVDLPGATTGALVTTYTDTQVAVGTTYRYTVMALCPPCTPPRSDASNLVMVTVGAPPTAPPGLTARGLIPVRSARADRAEVGFEAARAIDGALATSWHTPWRTTTPPPPHWLELDLGQEWWTAGLHYTPRPLPDRSGHMLDYVIAVSADARTWTEVARGTFAPTALPQEVRWTPAVLARYVRLTASSNIDAQPYSSAAEVGIIQGQQP